MKTSERRTRLLSLLQKSDTPLRAADLAERFGVTRQVIVSDVALLRANGENITATPRGYLTERPPSSGIPVSIVCRHAKEQTLAEFYAVVDNGGAVDDVIVEHPLYGQLSARLNISSRYDADEFVRQAKSCGASQLCDLTGGLHLHTLRVPDHAAYLRIIAALRTADILAEDAEIQKQE